MKGAYYNEIEPYAADWLRNLIAAGHIPAGDVDERSIADVRADELLGYAQCHFFAGLGGWSRALRLDGWPDDRPVWTGSCPCPPFSAAGKGSECPSCGGKSCFSHPLVTAGWVCLDCGDEWRGDDRHLLPEFLRLWLECRPPDVFGEQVASRDGVLWLYTLRSTVELGGYALGASDLPSAGFGAPHIRQRLMFGSFRVANADRDQQRLRREHRGAAGEGLRLDADGRGGGGRLGVAAGGGCERERDQPEHGQFVPADARPGRLADAASGRLRSWGGSAAPGLQRTEQPSDVDRAAHRLGDPGRDGDRQHARKLRGHEGEHGVRPEDRDHASVVAGTTGGMAESASERWERRQGSEEGDEHYRDATGRPQGVGGPFGSDEDCPVSRGHNGGPGPTNGFWRDPDWLFCRDGKWRPVESGTCPLAHGVPARVGRLRAYGNAINPIQGAAFISAFDGARQHAIGLSVDQRGNVRAEA